MKITTLHINITTMSKPKGYIIAMTHHTGVILMVGITIMVIDTCILGGTTITTGQPTITVFKPTYIVI